MPLRLDKEEEAVPEEDSNELRVDPASLFFAEEGDNRDPDPVLFRGTRIDILGTEDEDARSILNRFVSVSCTSGSHSVVSSFPLLLLFGEAFPILLGRKNNLFYYEVRTTLFAFVCTLSLSLSLSLRPNKLL